FNCVARMGWMQRMTQFKDKAGKNAQNASVGLFTYPTLMAADILLYHATHVPVGDDQKQHLELTRDIATKFNHDFGQDFFPITEPVIGGPAARVMSLRDGSKKMSKSDPSDLSRINMADDADTIAQKIRKAKTDPEALPSEEVGLDGRAEARNLVAIYAALADESYVRDSRDLNTAGLAQLAEGLQARGLHFIPSVANFLCFDCGAPAEPLYRQLLAKGIIVRPVAGYGLPNHLRVSVGLAEENAAFLAALDEVRADG
ncbi:MAG: aminotransferase class I/II-fold pyridoxal phosphate-dependent enzyme, partial [Alcanivoracaceae bacterium]